MDAVHEYGPLQVLPIEDSNEDGESSDVYKYLLSVRDEAWNGSPVEFIDREIKSEPEPTQEEQEQEQEKEQEQSAEVTEEAQEGVTLWQQQLLAEFKDIKQQLAQVDQPATLLEIPEDASHWRKFILNNEPPTIEYFVHQLDKPTKVKLLVYITKWLTMSNASIANLSQWIWKILLTIDTRSMLTPDEIFVLRKLAKKTIKVKETSTETSSVGNMTIDMIITLVCRHYGQLDLLQQ
ncbi:uncharacterized protein SPAPADRAFT_63208 [Spathaspora passalidarum NRRL Y-27907]|uniref:Uncharacterized protein n=1 Tax=Spathaspora passalidarum (strain NRRL Y-27907 / 11-Y1) TaxID=619300 RepID=G3ATX7_SPAPN|nr:uncharacterized protein SPAPADRAFT_63208 [Spathaspora passalidarum NRRL Y-27907]EGW30353.1 hypothetical protein SPAPADRAFT_63208 [Spathaspora passalidarum NRRL Y-27907]